MLVMTKGKNTEKRKVAKKLLAQNVDIKIILNATGLSKKEIEKLKMF